ncbi:hypothetical protein C5167_029717 [Papaver somniferum]|uniref:mulatexin-like n=1 Tax=Papaver somniferum TaxID=3469 RepID=UPI000E6FCB14|nr:mulatexin-like [Papaver somniferum]RZC90583.1 hypothetical protein C5167_029717 [Papaver somniferum]
MGSTKEIKMAKNSCSDFVLVALLFFMVVLMCSGTASAIQCKSGERSASTVTPVCLTCIPQCALACPFGSSITSTNCRYQLFALPLCECCCKMPMPSPPPPSPSPPPPSPPPPSPPPPSPPPPSPSPPPPSPPPPPPSCTQECPYEMEYSVSPDQQPCRYVLA